MLASTKESSQISLSALKDVNAAKCSSQKTTKQKGITATDQDMDLLGLTTANITFEKSYVE